MTVEREYRPEIDGLRALAVLAILLNHAGVEWLPGGYLGVDLFFVISGFVITRLFVAELASGTFTLRAFWRRRVRRIVPALAVMLAACLLAAWVLLSPAQMLDFKSTFIGAAFMVPNIVLWVNLDGYFATKSAAQPLLHLWSLGVEEQFYLLFPLLLPVLWRAGPMVLRFGLWGLAIASLATAVILISAAPSAGFFLLPARIWELLAGALAALTLWRPGVRAAQVWAGLGLILILVPMAIYGPSSPGLETVPPVLGGVLCILAARRETWVGRVLCFRPVLLLGKASYGTYLWHWPLLAFARVQMAEEPSLGVKLGLLLVAVALGLASWRFVEAPFRRSTAPVLPKAGAKSGFAVLAALACLAVMVWQADQQGWRKLNWPGVPPEEMTLALSAPERSRLIGTGTCHMSNEAMPSGPFIADWNCLPAEMDGAMAWPVALYGDSIASNFAMVLRLTGRSPMQMSGYGCSIVPSRMRPECRIMADKMRAAAKSAGIRTVILVNRWQKSETTPKALVELEIWWGEVFETVVLVGPLPRIPLLEEKVLRWPSERVAGLQPDFEAANDFAKARKRVSGSELVIIDGAALFCGGRPGCSVMDPMPLMFDEAGHLTVDGAKRYAHALQASGILDQLQP